MEVDKTSADIRKIEAVSVKLYWEDDMNSIQKKNKKYNLIIVFVLTNILFLFLYGGFIFGGQTFIFNDIGADTVSQYFPYYVFDAEQFRSGNLTEFSLQMGLGGSAFERIIALLNPFEFVLLLCNNETMYIGIIVSVYLKTVFIALISYLYFEQVLSNRYSQIICSIIWTFCSYITLWGQHYAFSTNIAYFTLFMFVLQLYLQSDKLLNKWMPLIIFLFALHGYYFLYMVGLFSIAYIIGYGILKKSRIKTIILKLLGLGGMAVIGILIAAFVLAVGVGAFLGSERSGGNSYSLLSKLFDFRDFNYLFTVIARVLSNNTLGTGDNFCGWSNYYEAPMLFTSNLFGFSLVYSFMEKGRWKRGGMYLLGLFSVFCSAVSIVMTGFSGEYLRWTFVLCFMMIVGIGYMLDHLLQTSDETKKKSKRCAFVGVGLYGIIYCFLFFTDRERLSLRVLACSLFFVMLYAGWMFFFSTKYKKWSAIMLFIIVILEAGICNVRSIYQRSTLSVEESKVYISDSTVQLVDYMKEIDSGVYRARKMYGTVGLNDALAQGFNSLSWYESVLPSSLNQYVDENNVPPLLYDTCIDFPPERYNLITLLGTRYIMAYTDTPMDLEKYDMIYQYGDKVLYRNKYALPFGYLYYNQVQNTDLENLTDEQRDSALTRYFYYTDESIIEEEEVPLIKDINVNLDVTEDLVVLSQNGLKDVILEDNVLSGEIKNVSTENAILCIPIFYEDTWKAYVDGEPCQTYDINGGLIGITIAPGEHTIKLIYRNNYMIIGTVVSLISVLCYAILFWIYKGKKKEPKMKKSDVGSKVNDYMNRLMLNKPKELYVSSYFVMKKYIRDEIIRYKNAYPYVIGLVLRTTRSIGNVDIQHRQRVNGQSGYTFGKLLGLWLNGFTAFSVLPLRIAMYFGGIVALVGFVCLIYVVINKVLNPLAPIGWSSTIAILLLLGGAILLVLGMIREYVGRIYISLNSSPQYVVKEVICDRFKQSNSRGEFWYD